MAEKILVENLWWRYQSSEDWVLKNINITVERGEFLGIVGPSGAGKTTLCLALVGLIPKRMRGVMRGRILIDGTDIRKMPLNDLTSRVGLVFQDPEVQFVTMSVEDEVAFPLENRGVPRDIMKERVREALERVGMWEYRDKYPHELSGGQKQRVAIASMLALRPEVLILDEPTSDLDSKGKIEVMETLDSLRENCNLTLIVVEHDTELLAKYADRIILLYNGEIVREGFTKNFFKDVKFLVEKGVQPPQVSELFYELSKMGFNVDGLPLTVEEALELLSGIYVNPGRPKRYLNNTFQKEVGDGEPVITVDNLAHVYPDGTKALKGITFNVRRREYIAIIGKNGSGKTTLVKHLVGLLKPTEGRVMVFGRDTRSLRISELSTKIGYVYQNPDHQLFCQTVYEEIAYGLRNLGLPEEEVKRRVKKVAVKMSLDKRLNDHPFILSKGERQRLAVATVLAMEPEVIIVDEPTTGQDAYQSKSIMRLLDELNHEGKTIIVITHNMRLVAEHARRVIVMDDGRIVLDGPVRQVFSNHDVLRRLGIISPQVTRLSAMLGLKFTALSVRELVESMCPTIATASTLGNT